MDRRKRNMVGWWGWGERKRRGMVVLEPSTSHSIQVSCSMGSSRGFRLAFVYRPGIRRPSQFTMVYVNSAKWTATEFQIHFDSTRLDSIANNLLETRIKRFLISSSWSPYYLKFRIFVVKRIDVERCRENLKRFWKISRYRSCWKNYHS